MREIMVGLVGYGFGGSVFHAPLIASTSGLRLAAVVTRRECDLPGVRVISNVPELLADPAIELVVVSSPTNTHFEVARGALLAGKHVVVDKPFTTSVDEANELIDLATAGGRLLSVYQNRRWDGDFLTVKHCISRKALGTVYFYEAHFDRFRPQIKPGWREESSKGSGILYDLGAHLIDQALVLFGMPEAIDADAFAQRQEARSVDYFHLILHYGRARVILHGSTLVRTPGPHFAMHGDEGSFVKYGMDPQEAALIAGERPGGAEWGVDAPENYGELVTADGSHSRVQTIRGSYETYYQRMESAIRNGSALPVEGVDARNGLMVIEAAIRGSDERRTLAIS